MTKEQCRSRQTEKIGDSLLEQADVDVDRRRVWTRPDVEADALAFDSGPEERAQVGEPGPERGRAEDGLRSARLQPRKFEQAVDERSQTVAVAGADAQQMVRARRQRGGKVAQDIVQRTEDERERRT